MSASMLSPSATASDRRLSTTAPEPSPRTNPSADASNVLHLPSAARACDLERNTPIPGESIRLTPPATARRHSLLRRLWHARWTVTSDDEQAVSTAILGPCKPSRYDKRPALKQKPLPVPE